MRVCVLSAATTACSNGCCVLPAKKILAIGNRTTRLKTVGSVMQLDAARVQLVQGKDMTFHCSVIWR